MTGGINSYSSHSSKFAEGSGAVDDFSASVTRDDAESLCLLTEHRLSATEKSSVYQSSTSCQDDLRAGEGRRWSAEGKETGARGIGSPGSSERDVENKARDLPCALRQSLLSSEIRTLHILHIDFEAVHAE
jgi:hypothetical protein